MSDPKEIIGKWESAYLAEAWIILASPEWENGEPILRGGDIEALGAYIKMADKETLALKLALQRSNDE